MLLAEVQNLASRQALVTLDALAVGLASADRHAPIELALRVAEREVDRSGTSGTKLLEDLRELGVIEQGATQTSAEAYRRFQTELEVGLSLLRGGDHEAAYIYGIRRVRPTFEAMGRTIGTASTVLGREAERARWLAELGGAATLLVALILLFALQQRLNNERRRLEDKLQHEALHDPLTDLPNRRLFQDRVERACAGKARGHGTALLFVDLDGFKVVNDSKGHDAGDRILTGVAERLKGCVRASDTVARIGGDEFAIVLGDVTQPVEVVGLADRIIESLSRPFDLVSSTACIGASVGVAIHDHAESPSELCARADAAMYSAKRSGRGAYCVSAGSSTTAEAPILGRVLLTA